MIMEKNRKKIILAAVAIVMIGCLLVVGTLAWLQYRTDNVVNTFTLGTGVKIELKEEKYDRDEKKNEFTPGMIIDKDPVVSVPEDVKMEEYIAATVRYYIEEVDDRKKEIRLKEVDYNTFKDRYAKLYSFNNGNSTNVKGDIPVPTELERNYSLAEGIRDGWITANHQVFYYGTGTIDALALTPVASGSAITLFDKVMINDPFPHTYDTAGEYTLIDDVGNTTIREISAEQLEGFRISICAYAVQGNISSEKGKAALDALIAGG